MDTSKIRWFDELKLADRPLVGGKGASLGELTRAGIAVPPGFIVTTKAFDRFLDDAGIAAKIHSDIGGLEQGDDARIARVSRGIRDALCKVPIPEDVSGPLADAYAKLSDIAGIASVAVRSSATCEDSDEASFAGLQDTYLWVDGQQALEDNLRACWASLYNAESVSYRLRLGLDESQLAMAVVVQSMVDADCAGVMFTRSPTTGDRSVVVIEACWGLGSCLVSGEVTPDRYVVNKVTGEITVRDVSAKTTRHVRAAHGHGVLEEAVPANLATAPCLSDDDLKGLWQTARSIEAHYGSPQDIEWAIPAHGDTARPPALLLQSRPETIWAKKQREPTAKPMAKPFDHVLSVMSTKKS